MSIRVASTQYRTGNDVQANLQTLLSLIDEAAAGGAQLVVAPEFGNHTSFYEGPEQAWEVAAGSRTLYHGRYTSRPFPQQGPDWL